MSRMKLSSALTLFIFTLISAIANAGIYKWVDEEGQTHYSQNPPAGQQAQQLRGINTDYTPPPPKATDVKGAKGDKDAKDAGAGNADDKKAEKDPYTAEQHKKLCTNAKNDLATMAKSGRLRVKQDDGSTKVMSDKERAEREKTMKDMVSKHCK